MPRNKRSKAQAKDALIAEIERWAKRSHAERTQLELSWFLNQLWYQGFQHTNVDQYSGATKEISGEVRYRANKIASAIHHSVAKLTKSPPDWDVDSDEGTQATRAARHVAERWLEYVWEKTKLQSKSRDLAFEIRIFGTSFLYVYWDPNRGEELDPKDFIELGPRGKVVGLDDVREAFDGDEKAAAEFIRGDRKLRMGDVCVELASPFDVHVDHSATCVDDARWMMLSRVRHIEDVRQRFGDAAKDVSPEAEELGGPVWKYRLRQYIDPNVGTGGSTKTFLPDTVLVSEYWERPSKEFPKGRYCAYAGGVVLKYGDNPYYGLECELPFVRFRDMHVPGRFHGSAAMSHAIPAQMNYNKARGDQIMISHDHAAPQWMVPNGADVKQIDRRSNRLIRYNLISNATGAPVKPERVPPAQVSSLTTSSLEMADAEIQEAMGVHDVSQGDVPSGVKSGVAIQLLQETDETRLGSIMQEMHEGLAVLGRMILDLGKNFIVEERSFAEVSGKSKGEIIHFTGENLGWRAVRVRLGLLANRSRTAKQQMLTELVQYAPDIFAQPDKQKMLLDAFGLDADIRDPLAVHKKRAIWENTQLEKGMPAKVTDYQDHDIHLQILEERMNELSFDELPEQIQELFHRHRMEHMEMKDATAMRELQLQQAIQSGAALGAGPQAGPMSTGADVGGAQSSAPDEEQLEMQLPPGI